MYIKPARLICSFVCRCVSCQELWQAVSLPTRDSTCCLFDTTPSQNIKNTLYRHGTQKTCFAQEGCPQEEGGEAQVAQAPQQQEGCCAQAQEEEELQEGLGDVSTRRRGHWFCLQEVFQCVGAGAGLIFARSLTFGLLFLFL